jgi:hypothetical protein
MPGSHNSLFNYRNLSMTALCIHAGPRALKHLQSHGLQATDVQVVPAAAGGPKGLILNPLDQWLFGDWLASSSHTVHLLGASIGAWRMAAAAMARPVNAFARLAHDYIAQEYDVEPGKKGPSAKHVSDKFGQSLRSFYGDEVPALLAHPRYRVHVVTSRGRHLLGREGRLRSPAGYFGAFMTNAVSRRAMGAWLERVVFSSGAEGLPFKLSDYRSREIALTTDNFHAAVQASCSIPFVLNAVHDIPGAPRGAYWDGGITDYHLHLNYGSMLDGLVLYPHFQAQVVPGWLDKALKHRHKSTPFLDNLVLLSPSAEWVATLPNKKIPDRTDFKSYGQDTPARVKAWTQAVAESRRLADEFAQMVARQDWSAVKPLV